MVSLLAIYQESIEAVVAHWNSNASSLGFELLQPLESERHGWDYLRLSGDKMFASVRQPYNLPGCEGTRWLDLMGSSQAFDSLTEVFYKILSSSLQPTEVILIDHDIDCVSEYVTYYLPNSSAIQLLEVTESGYYGSGLHSLRAFRLDLAGPLAEWALGAKEMGFGWTEVGSYCILDVRWHERGCPKSERDPLTGLATEQEFFSNLHSLLETTHGTLMVINLSEVIPNPERSYGRWCQVLPEDTSSADRLFQIACDLEGNPDCVSIW